MSNDPDLNRLLAGLGRSSGRLRIFAVITALICLGLASLPLFDSSLWASGIGWQIGLILFEVFMMGVAGLMLYGAFFKVKRRVALLKRIIQAEPERIVSLRPMIAKSVPIVHWEPDDGTSTIGLHIFIEDSSGASWILPATRTELDSMLADLSARCPAAKVG